MTTPCLPLFDPARPVVVVGLISGTSADGVDAACCRLAHPPGEGLAWEVLGTAARPYPDDLAGRLARPATLTTPELAACHARVGIALAEAALASVEAAGIGLDEVALVGSHGQTVWHDPGGRIGGAPVTLQIGEPAEIVERTGRPVWSDFRPADVAAGGEGAPLVPYADWLLFGGSDRPTVCLNLGGIANVTLLPVGAAPADVVAFDTGPANALLDVLARRLLGARLDEGGARAARGRVEADRLEAALAHPYFTRPAPKSTGPETFGAAFVDERFAPLDGLDGEAIDARLATAAALTVESIGRALEGAAGTPPVPDDAVVLVGGGGRRNRALMDGLAHRLAPRGVVPVDERGLDGDMKEAVAFAVLAYESALGRPVALRAATGARHPVVAGRLSFPPPA